MSIRPLTGSVVIERESGALEAASEVEKVLAVLLHEVRDDGRPLTRTDVMRGAVVTTRLAAAVVQSARDLDADLRAALDGRADLGTLGPFALIVVGAIQVSWSGKLPTPSWSSLAWYALRSFISFNPQAIGDLSRSMDRPGGESSPPHDFVDQQDAPEGASP